MAETQGFGFEIQARTADGAARLGMLRTPHGALPTPNFIFCGTKAAIKGVTTRQMRAANTDIILANTYHLMIQPGAETVAAMGGLHGLYGLGRPDADGQRRVPDLLPWVHGSVADEIKGRRQPDPGDDLDPDQRGGRGVPILSGWVQAVPVAGTVHSPFSASWART